MRRKLTIYTIFAAALCACSPQNNLETSTRVSARLQVEATAPTDFQDGDQIGVSAREYNVPICTNSVWTYANGHFIGSDTIAVERGSELRLSAYYPYEAELDSEAPMLTIDTREADYTDYLWATDTLQLTASGMQANLQFRHILTRMEFVFHPSAEFPSGEMISLTLSGVKAKVEKNMATGVEMLSGDATMGRSTLPEQPIQILLPAQTALPTITFAYAGHSYQVTPDTEHTYVGGHSYRYDIAFGPQTDPTISQIQISDQSTNFQLAPSR